MKILDLFRKNKTDEKEEPEPEPETEEPKTDYETWRRTIPFDTKKEIFDRLRYQVPTRSIQEGILKEFGRDALLFCVGEAVRSSGFETADDTWPILCDLLGEHPMLNLIGIYGNQESEAESEESETDIIADALNKNTKFENRQFAQDAKARALLFASQSPKVRELAKETGPFVPREALKFIDDESTVIAHAAWRALALNPSDSPSVCKLVNSPAFDERVASIQAVARGLNLHGSIREFDFAAPTSSKNWTASWFDGAPVPASFCHWIKACSIEQIPDQLLVPTFNELSGESFDLACGELDPSMSANLKRLCVSSAGRKIRFIIASANTPEENAAAAKKIATTTLKESVTEEEMCQLAATAEARPWVLQCVESQTGNLWDSSFRDLLALADEEGDDAFYFALYRETTTVKDWLDGAAKVVAITNDPTDWLATRMPRRLGVPGLIDLARMGPKVEKFLNGEFSQRQFSEEEKVLISMAFTDWDSESSARILATLATSGVR